MATRQQAGAGARWLRLRRGPTCLDWVALKQGHLIWHRLPMSRVRQEGLRSLTPPCRRHQHAPRERAIHPLEAASDAMLARLCLRQQCTQTLLSKVQMGQEAMHAFLKRSSARRMARKLGQQPIHCQEEERGRTPHLLLPLALVPTGSWRQGFA